MGFCALADQWSNKSLDASWCLVHWTFFYSQVITVCFLLVSDRSLEISCYCIHAGMFVAGLSIIDTGSDSPVNRRQSAAVFCSALTDCSHAGHTQKQKTVCNCFFTNTQWAPTNGRRKRKLCLSGHIDFFSEGQNTFARIKSVELEKVQLLMRRVLGWWGGEPFHQRRFNLMSISVKQQVIITLWVAATTVGVAWATRSL